MLLFSVRFNNVRRKNMGGNYFEIQKFISREKSIVQNGYCITVQKYFRLTFEFRIKV